MPTHPKALPSRGSQITSADPDALAPQRTAAESTVEPLDFDATAALSDAALRARAREAPAPGARLAACWRLMIRGQALPQTAPTEGIRLLTLINLATQQDLELLEVLLCFDPCSDVRAQAADLLWRVARDRDRVVDRLVSRLQQESSAAVITHLLTLQPSLPADRIGNVVRSHLRHASLEVRQASWNWWLPRAEPMDAPMIAALESEPSPELRAWCLSRWAERPDHPRMLHLARAQPLAAGEVLDALFQAKRSFPLADLSPLLAHCPVDAVLRLARGPFDAADRRLLVSLTGLLPKDRANQGWMGQELRRCLQAAYAETANLMLTDEERSWPAILEERLTAAAAEPAFDEEDDDEDPYSWECGLEDTMALLDLLRNAQSSPAP